MAAPKKQEQKKVTLSATKRDIKGKAVRKMRKEGMLPANIFGKDFASTAISINALEFRNTHKVVKATGVVFVEYDKESVPCLISQIQRHPVTDGLLHVDLRRISLKEKTEAEVPIKIVGEAPAVKTQHGVLITQLDTLTVEALPTDIPSEVEIDISVIKEIGDEIKVQDLPKNPKYVFTNEPDSVIISVTAHKEEELEPDTETTLPEGAEPEAEKKEEGAAEKKSE